MKGRAGFIRIMCKQINDWQTVLKVLTDKDPYVHLSLVIKTLGVESHITIEPREGQPKEHKHWGFMSREKMLRSYLRLFARPGSYPPRMTSVENREEMRKVHQWLESEASRISRPARHRLVLVFRDGDLKTKMNQLLNRDQLLEGEFDIEGLVRLADKTSDAEALETKYEDEIRSEELELAMLKRPDRVMLVYPDGTVMELRIASVQRWQRTLVKMPGIEELFDELHKRGTIARRSQHSDGKTDDEEH